jgi:RsiW-degrading membrane proteinase PrsW (M82 family)
MNSAPTEASFARSFWTREHGRVSGPFSREHVYDAAREGRFITSVEISADARIWMPLGEWMAAQPAAPTVAIKILRHSALPAVESGLMGSATDCMALTQMESVRHVHATGVLLTVMLFPLLLVVAVHQFGLTMGQTAWLVSAYYCLIWAFVLRSFTPADESGANGRLFLYAIMTAFVGIPMLLTWSSLPLVSSLAAAATGVNATWMVQAPAFTLGIGLPEEMCKLVPMVFLGMRTKGGVRSIADGMRLGVASGLGFAWAEGIQYSVQYWNESAWNSGMVADTLAHSASGIDAAAIAVLAEKAWQTFLSQQVRFLTLPAMHAVWAGLASGFAAAAYLSRRWGWLLAGVGLASLLHGLYNTFCDSIIGVVAAGAAAIVFVHANEWLTRHVMHPQTMGSAN